MHNTISRRGAMRQFHKNHIRLFVSMAMSKTLSNLQFFLPAGRVAHGESRVSLLRLAQSNQFKRRDIVTPSGWGCCRLTVRVFVNRDFPVDN